MTHRQAILRHALLILDRMDGTPLAGKQLADGLRVAMSGNAPSDADAFAAVRDAEAKGYIRGIHDADLEDTMWVLTPKGGLALDKFR